MSAFDKVFGQPYVTGLLRAELEAGRPASSYLFFGPPGCGKKTAAQALGQALICPGQPGKGCLQCSSCRRVAGRVHPDYFLFSPAGTTYKVEQIRDLLREASLRPFESPRRVFVIDQAELLNDSSGNALLKILEEPSAAVTFVLVTTARSALLSTIASRCQAVRFSPLPEPVLMRLLIERQGLKEAEARAAAGLAGGSTKAAERLLSEDGRMLRDLAEGLLEAAALPSRVMKLNWAALAAQDKKKLGEVLELAGANLRELWVEKKGLAKELRLLPQPPAHGGGLSPAKIEALLDAIPRAQAQLRLNLNTSLVLEHLALTEAAA